MKQHQTFHFTYLYHERQNNTHEAEQKPNTKRNENSPQLDRKHIQTIQHSTRKLHHIPQHDTQGTTSRSRKRRRNHHQNRKTKNQTKTTTIPDTPTRRQTIQTQQHQSLPLKDKQNLQIPRHRPTRPTTNKMPNHGKL